MLFEEAVKLAKANRTPEQEARFQEELDRRKDEIGRLASAIERLDVEQADYRKDYDGPVPEIPKGALDDIEAAHRHGQGIALLDVQLVEDELRDQKRTIARRRLAHGAHEKVSLAAEKKAAQDELKKLT